MMRITDITRFAELTKLDNVKVSLNKRKGTGSAFGFSGETDVGELGYACWNGSGRRRFRTGDVNLVFVSVGGNDLLFVAALRIMTETEGGACAYGDVTAEFGLAPYARRLQVADSEPRKTKLGAWVFKASRLDDLRVLRYDGRAEWSGLEWRGYDRVSLSCRDLFDVIESDRHPEYRAHLEDACGVYVLTDVATGLKYVGSAYGEKGLAQRWKHYLDTGHGGNVRMKGEGYFRKNFRFELLCHYPLGTSKERMIERESFFKRVIGTRENGLNVN